MKVIRNSEVLNKHNLDQIYVSYFFYSKYEHFGATTNSIQTMDADKLFYILMDSFTYILLACMLCCGHFENAFYRFKEEGQKLFNLREDFIKIVNIGRPVWK